MIDAAKKDRMRKSADHFWQEIRPRLEPRLKATIHPLELLQRNELVDAFDQVGIDAFTVNRGGHLQGLSSRMQYSFSAEQKPNFSFRYARWVKRKEEWDYDREYPRKLYAITHTEKAILYPYYHVESCIQNGALKWSYITKTSDIIQYIDKYMEDEDRVHIFKAEDKDKPGDKKEKRLVVCAYIEEYRKTNSNVVKVIHPNSSFTI